MEATEAILISNKPKEVVEIFNGKKTIDIRKTAPKDWVDYLCGRTKAKPKPRTAYIYCIKDGLMLITNMPEDDYVLNGKVVAKFTLREVEMIYWMPDLTWDPNVESDYVLKTDSLNEYVLQHMSCMKRDELEDYIGCGCELDEYGYAWHISDLEIFDKPKQLNEFMQVKLPNPKKFKFATWKAHYYWAFGDYLNKITQTTLISEAKRAFDDSISLKRPPQSWQYVEVRENENHI